MWRSLMSSRFASWVIGKISLPKPRQLQQELDMQRLYILTHLHRAAAQGKSVNMQQLILKTHSLEPSAVRAEVNAELSRQVIAVAEHLHDILTQACDPAHAATSLTAVHRRTQRRLDRDASGFTKLVRSFTRRDEAGGAAGAGPAPASGGLQQLQQQEQGAGGAGAVASCDGSRGGSSGGSGGGAVLSAGAVAAELRQRVGFGLELRPSSVPHPEAGTGLFVSGGDVRPGSVVAIFPGVLYGRTQLAHMPNYPRVDTDNPFLSCRYDQSIVDSKPWGRGDPGGTSSPSSSPTTPTPTSSSSSSPPSPPSWWGWAGPLSASLALLEGRHPLALAHWVNHPGRGQSPNVLEAALDLPLDHPALNTPARPWLRAYLPSLQPPLHYDPYGKEDEDEDDEEEEEEDDGGKKKRSSGVGSSGSSSASGGKAEGNEGKEGQGQGQQQRRKRAPGELRAEELFSPPGGVVRLLVLVSTRALREGEELLQNYRMNPHVTRPEWYVVHDEEAEQRRWAKAPVLDLGFKGAKAPAGGAAGPEGRE
ncbi:hypothetical protein Agub_g5733 [Astrephomene gubernaculifera]|uniref:SET domain-containing protein n=1 Tax=Astrephomene gubernaculifera TaxID=47775 RepID=A0AAD3DMA1_9CHLO|nr:hypothetical protein Agub_g5733 [Astrephomene gubernaculifera]